ncbi:PilZ domain-containing protein [Desulfopila inferna]|uniref:PilZ domain-containing protein n=1 Tax=Desulfopila inferna TaxID=468528 RepID=UPI00196273A1|nr:PilZ domain-containing protein [Desulfopila inferna]MBM9604029.1 PilZ domain-containing protein [Desulfopila inferna]
MNKNDRRYHERFLLQLQAKLSAAADSAGNPINEVTTAVNISSGGAFLITDIPIPLASRVYLEFLVDYDQLKKLRFILSAGSLKKLGAEKIWVKATGVVIRAEETGLGIIFDQDYQLSPMDTAG